MIDLFANLFFLGSINIDTLPESLIFLAIGVLGLYFGAEFMVKGSSRLARAFGIKPLIIGLTLVAFGTSAPELVVSLFSGLGKAKTGGLEASLGNIVGSNIANIALILGVTAIIKPLRVRRKTMQVEFPFMIIITVIFWALALWGHGIQLIDGVILLACFVIFVLYCILSGKEEDIDIPKDKNIVKNIIFSVLGLGFLALGGFGLVEGSIYLAIKEFNISPEVVGLTVMAIGTSLPELVISVVAQLRGHADISVGNVLGSNIFNVALVMGLLALIIGIVQPETVKYQADEETNKTAMINKDNQGIQDSILLSVEPENQPALPTTTDNKNIQKSSPQTINYIPASENTLVWNFSVMLFLTFLVWGLLFLRREKISVEEATKKGLNAKQFTVFKDKNDGVEKIKTLRLGRTAGLILLVIYIAFTFCLYTYKGWAPWNYDESKPSLTQDYLED